MTTKKTYLSVTPQHQTLKGVSVQETFLAHIAYTDERGNIFVQTEQDTLLINHMVSGLPALQVDDRAVVDRLSNGELLLKATLARPGQNTVMQCELKDGHAQVLLPEQATSFTVTLGDASLTLNRDGHISLSGKTIVSEAEKTNQLIGKPVSLN